MNHEYGDFFQLILEELFQTDRVEKQYGGTLRKQRGRRSGMNEIGKGTQSAAKFDRNDPHMIVKHSMEPYEKNIRDDGFNAFINYLINNKLMGENIHLPRVYNVKTIRDANGKHIHKYTVEKLIAYNDISKDEILAFAEVHLQPDSMQFSDHEDDSVFVTNAFRLIAMHLGKCILYPTLIKDYVRSETLAEALKIIRQASMELGKPEDLHPGNYMWRRGSTGLTLVFNDPFY